MRISKTLVAFCAIAVGAALIGNATADTEAQAKAREALRKKLAEEGRSTPGSPAPAPAATVAPVPPARPAAAAPGQADKQREALRQKIQELNQQGASAPATPAPTVAPAPVVAPAPIAPRSPAVKARAVSPAAPSADEEKLRQALRHKIQELNQQEAVVTPTPIAAPVAVVAPAPVAVMRESKAIEPSPNQEQLRQAVRQKIQELNQPVAGTTAQAPVAAPQTPAVSEAQLEQMRQQVRAKIAEDRSQEPVAAALVAPVQPISTDAADPSALTPEARARRDAELAATRAAVEEQRRAQAAAEAAAALQNPTLRKPATQPGRGLGASGFAPMVAPPTALSSSKETRLADLTRRYKADEMTPEEYHKERAKLIAEP